MGRTLELSQNLLDRIWLLGKTYNLGICLRGGGGGDDPDLPCRLVGSKNVFKIG